MAAVSLERSTIEEIRKKASEDSDNPTGLLAYLYDITDSYDGKPEEPYKKKYLKEIKIYPNSSIQSFYPIDEFKQIIYMNPNHYKNSDTLFFNFTLKTDDAFPDISVEPSQMLGDKETFIKKLGKVINIQMLENYSDPSKAANHYVQTYGPNQNRESNTSSNSNNSNNSSTLGNNFNQYNKEEKEKIKQMRRIAQTYGLQFNSKRGQEGGTTKKTKKSKKNYRKKHHSKKNK